ncbi:hypothetical protein [Amycolatopsis anabasis]|uniref:hypothetical protein n=1 Tax=Amycolatopsis anabasis TaxID=1840409 RepID=UPI00131AD53E|nr:hypothetical protein [Amycolatopsis anabasis]
MTARPGSPERGAGEEHAARVRDAITYTRRVSREARARGDRHRVENAELAAEFRARRLAGTATEATPTSVRDAAKRFRLANGLPVADLPAAGELVPPKRRPRPKTTPKSEDDEDFSQERIMIRGD